jgi:hypothetical protein
MGVTANHAQEHVVVWRPCLDFTPTPTRASECLLDVLLLLSTPSHSLALASLFLLVPPRRVPSPSPLYCSIPLAHSCASPSSTRSTQQSCHSKLGEDAFCATIIAMPVGAPPSLGSTRLAPLGALSPSLACISFLP